MLKTRLPSLLAVRLLPSHGLPSSLQQQEATFGFAMSEKGSSSAAKAFILTRGLSASLFTEPLESAGSAGYAAASHHAKLASSKPSFLRRLVSPPKNSEDNEDHLADGCIVM